MIVSGLSYVPVVASFIVGLACAALVSRLGMRIGLADVPNARSSHQRPVPRGGGVGIPLAAALTAFAWSGQFQPYLIAALSVSFIALLTDFHELPVKLRFVFQLALAAMVVWLAKGDMITMMVSLRGIPAVVVLIGILTVFIVAGTNFFNFMDGINGIAGLQGIVAFSFLGVYAIRSGAASGVVLLMFSVAAAALGFLLMNFPVARVFMGDVGSIFLGFLFCAMVVALMGNPVEFLVLALFNGVFFVDCVSTLILRMVRHENVFLAHRKHLYQELVHKGGWSHLRVTLHFAAVQVIVCVGALFLSRTPLSLVLAVWAVLFVVYWGVRWRFGYFNRV